MTRRFLIKASILAIIISPISLFLKSKKSSEELPLKNHFYLKNFIPFYTALECKLIAVSFFFKVHPRKDLQDLSKEIQFTQMEDYRNGDVIDVNGFRMSKTIVGILLIKQ